ncbi:KR-domain-containing protein [Melanomma pulvis-pyrius CBS 109.77]|uniref:KR-domain-containing protein n=1 Tax=Melanomma pulvis-pyrius CBS 109.77 TaxID=1314802 RepID=A0A6A6XG60_9PLEO|nr:KR-domain-containing protein [Melanomma pulvis-pyrius CBS 109.77]
MYMTVGSISKRIFLTNVYGIAAAHVFYSRDSAFADDIKRMTGGRGVDVIISSQQGLIFKVSWNSMAMFGRFVDIGLKYVSLRGQLPMHVFTRNASFSGINLETLVEHDKSLSRLTSMTPIQCCSLHEAEQALRFLQSGKPSGKIILEVHRTASVPTNRNISFFYRFRKDGTYIIASGLGGIGRSIACWLFERNAKNLFLISRSGGSKRAQDVVTELRSNGVKVQCPVCDIADLPSLRSALDECAKTMPPIRGCIQTAMVLRDSTFSKLTLCEWQQATRPKVQGSWNLHEVLPTRMDFFILLSSVAGIVGNLGQSSYCAGNTYQDAFARYRTSIGEKAVTIDVGVVLDEGFVAENQDPLHSQVVTGIDLPADIETRGRDIPSALEQPIFRYMQQAEGSYRRMQDSNSQVRTFQEAFTNADSASAGAFVVAEALKMKLSRVLGLPIAHINIESALDSYGVDSLVGLELRNWLSKESGADLAVFEILGGATMLQIVIKQET